MKGVWYLLTLRDPILSTRIKIWIHSSVADPGVYMSHYYI